MPERTLLYAECAAYAPVEVRLNDVTIGRLDGGGEEYRVFVPLPAFVLAGANRLSVHLAPGFRPPPAPPPVEGEPEKVWARVRVALFGEDEPAFERAGQTLAEIVWTLPFESRVRTVDFQSPIGPREWAWSRCDRLPPTAETRESALAFLERLKTAYLAADPAPVVAAAEPRIQDMARAFDMTPAEVVRAMTHAIVSAAPYVPAPPVAFAPQACAGDRLLDCLGADGLPYVRALEGEARELGWLTLMIGRIDGEWRVVR